MWLRRMVILSAIQSNVAQTLLSVLSGQTRVSVPHRHHPLGSFFATLRDVITIEDEQQVHEARGEGERGAVLERDGGDVAAAAHGAADEVERAGAHRSERGEDAEDVAFLDRVEAAVDQQANREQKNDDGKKRERAAA